MESKKAQKLSKATVATVLAASGVIVAMPQTSSASTFSDVSQYSDYYEPIVDLVNRKIISGYPDNTFRPNKSITREEAAKMLARTIDVNITNPANPGFKDVKTSDPNYRYIAALASEGIINGYPDGKFHPKEPITRAQMAKILSLGFKLGISTKLNHGFKDVPNNNPNAYYIQTLYDLNITKGVTAIKFDPFNTVTRAQMATFIWRAEKADRGTPVYEVGDIIGDQIYINGVAHTIASHLRSIINASNKNILKGAYIEGDFTGNKINNMTKLTINASGTSSRLLAMDGDYTSFAGELVVNGSYLRFKNINFTGRVELAEAPRRSLAELAGVRVAGISTFAGFIDWTPPTNNGNDGSLNPDEDETLVDKPDPSKPETKYKDRMPNLKKYVDFERAELRQVYVTANHAFLKADSDIDRLYVQGEISNFELYANANAMYVDTDFNTTIYGSHDITYAYKNSLKNVYLRSDATYDYYYVTAKNGYTNLGEFAYISNAIIPVKETVNDVFDDFETDEPNIGYIEDEDGKEVSRDPVGDNEVSDKTQPIITQLDVKAGGTVADVTMTANEDGTYYYVVRPSSEKAPSISEIKTGGFKFNGSGPITMDEQVKFQVTGLETKTEYTIYAIVIDDADNVSEKKSVDFTTIDNSPPRFTLQPGAKQPGGKRFEVKFTRISEPGTIYYYVRQKGSSAVDPTFEDIMKKYTGTVLVTKPEDLTEMIREVGADPNKSAVLPNTTYEVFAIMVDKTDNRSNLVEKIEVKTEAPDAAQPYVANDAKLEVVDDEKGIFEFTVSEELDPDTALDVNNYTLSGTAVLNITGQKTMKPSKVEINKTKVRLTIPALNALVKGDTIRVTVAKEVLDLAENQFENIDSYPADQNAPRNEAYYTHKDDLLPVIKINKVIIEKDRNLVEFEAPKKAGTYYYMILESDYDFVKKGITPRDFLDEFTLDSIGKTTKFGDKGKKDYTGNLLNQYGPAELGKNTKSIEIDHDKLDPFKSYSVYMILKDRAGLVSDHIVDAPIVSDSKAPLIDGLEVKPLAGTNDGASFNFTADEGGKLHVIPVPKYIKEIDPATNKPIYKLNTKYFNSDGSLIPIQHVSSTTSSEGQRAAFNAMGAAKTIEFTKGPNDKSITGLNPHEEYGFYIAAEDKTGATPNFTIFSRNSPTNPPSADEPNGAQMLKYVYTDGKAPEVVNRQIVYREGEKNADATYTITFSESILRQNGDVDPKLFNKSKDIKKMKLGDLLTIKGTSTVSPTTFNENDFEIVDYIPGNTTVDESKLIIKPKSSHSNAVAVSTFEIEMNDDVATVFDYDNINSKFTGARKGFVTNKIAKFVYTPGIVNTIIAAMIKDPTYIDSTTNRGKIVEVDMELGVPLELEPEFYYVVMQTNALNVPTAEDIINAVDKNMAITNMAFSGKGYIDTTTPSMGANRLIKLEAVGQNYFYSRQKVYMISIDKYGNIIWAEVSPGNKVGIIK